MFKKTLFALICAFAFFMNLEQITEVYLGVSTVLRPYRIIAILIFLLVLGSRNFQLLKTDSYSRPLLAVFGVGVLVALLRYPFADVDLGITFNYLQVLFFAAVMHIIVSNVSFTGREFFKISMFFVSSLVLNYLQIAFLHIGDVSLRESGFFENPNALGLSGLVGLILLVFFIINYKTTSKLIKPIMVVCIYPMFYLVNISGSRAVILTFFVVVLFLLIHFVYRNKFAIILIPFLVLFAVNSQVNKGIEINAIKRQQAKIKNGESSDIRVVLWNASIDGTLDSYLMGYGLNQFAQIDNFYKNLKTYSIQFANARRSIDKGIGSHNTYLDVAVNCGLIGLVFFMVFLYRKTLAYIKLVKAGKTNTQLIFLFLHVAMVVFCIFNVVLLSPLFWFFYGFNDRTIKNL